MELNPYLFFEGNCEQALDFYKTVFNGEILSLNRYEGTPGESQVPPDWKTKIMHASFQSPTFRFMASDGRCGDTPSAGSRISLSLGTRDLAEAERVFNRLAEGGQVDMPLQDTFWGARFGMLVDQFGIKWMINSEKA
ncbi:MAG TPA: VOC family protein [Candidatus Baltobacteraceae bacterium]|jgi:PhnB protein|nr:VOC family protein [Candidatus Baltobacteraceae bacterium]